MKCEIQTTDLGNGKYSHYCPTCKKTVVSPGKGLLRAQCPGLPKGPGPIQKAVNYVTAEAKWIAAGRPTRTGERINEIMEQHCRPCSYFTGEACRLCGCPINRARNFHNKLYLATESCPDVPSKWGAEPDSPIN